MHFDEGTFRFFREIVEMTITDRFFPRNKKGFQVTAKGTSPQEYYSYSSPTKPKSSTATSEKRLFSEIQAKSSSFK